MITTDKGKELVYATAVDINDMNPHVYIGSTSAQGMVYESLIENTEDGIKPLLAESWKVSDDGKVYTFGGFIERLDYTIVDGGSAKVFRSVTRVTCNIEKKKELLATCKW